MDIVKFSKSSYTLKDCEEWLLAEGYVQYERLRSSTKHHKFIATKQVYGGSFWSELVRHIKGIRDAIKGTRKGFNHNMREILGKIGDLQVIKLVVCRRPIQSKVSTLVKIVNTLTGHKPPEYETLFHLMMLVTVSDGKTYILEKNQFLNMEVYSPEKFDETMPVPIRGGLTINQLLKNALNKFGDERIYHYRSYSNNCQRFVLDVFEANGISVTNELKAFILQDVSHLVPHFAQKILNAATDLGNRSEMLIHGQGDEYHT